MLLLWVVYGLIIGSFICMLVVYIQQNTLNEIREDVYKFFLLVEHDYKKNESRLKFEEVVRLTKAMLPPVASIFISEELLRRTIQFWFDGIKDLLDDGKINNSGKGVY